MIVLEKGGLHAATYLLLEPQRDVAGAEDTGAAVGWPRHAQLFERKRLGGDGRAGVHEVRVQERRRRGSLHQVAPASHWVGVHANLATEVGEHDA